MNTQRKNAQKDNRQQDKREEEEKGCTVLRKKWHCSCSNMDFANFEEEK